MVICQVCKEKEAEQKHHVSYYPELTIDVCIDCHKLIHKHGVGGNRSSDTEIIKDSPLGVHIPLTSTSLCLAYRCSSCAEPIFYSQSLINLLLFRKPLSEPGEKCPVCGSKSGYRLILEDSSVTSDYGPHSYYVTSRLKEEP